MATETGYKAMAVAKATSLLTATSTKALFLKTEVKEWQVPSTPV